MDEMDGLDGWRPSLVIATNAWSSTRLAGAIGLEPNRPWDRGEGNPPSASPTRQGLSGVTYRSHLAGPADIELHLQNLLDRLASYKARIGAAHDELTADPGATLSVGVQLVVPAEADAQGLRLSCDQLREITDLGADLGLTVEFWGAVEEDGRSSLLTIG